MDDGLDVKKHQALNSVSPANDQRAKYFYIALFPQKNNTILKIYLLFQGYSFVQDVNTILTNGNKTPTGKLIKELANAQPALSGSFFLL